MAGETVKCERCGGNGRIVIEGEEYDDNAQRSRRYILCEACPACNGEGYVCPARNGSNEGVQ